jgi:hypothetical protein
MAKPLFARYDTPVWLAAVMSSSAIRTTAFFAIRRRGNTLLPFQILHSMSPGSLIIKIVFGWKPSWV